MCNTIVTNETKLNTRDMLESDFGATVNNKIVAHVSNIYINMSKENPYVLRHTNHVEPVDQSGSISTQ